MKRLRIFSILLIISMISQLFVVADAKSELYDENIQMALVEGGKVAIFEEKDTVLDNVPFKNGNSFMLPAEYFFESYGYEVAFDETSLTAKAEKTVTLTENSNIAVIDNSQVALEQNVQKVKDELFVSADICKALGLSYKISDGGVFVISRDGSFKNFEEKLFIKIQGIYIATDGKAGGDGTPKYPIPNLEMAKKLAIAHMKEYGTEFPVRIFVKGGTYRFSEGVEFTENEFKVDFYKGLSIENYDENVPEFTGSTLLDTADFIPVTDGQTLARLHKNGRGKIATIDLRKYGIKELEQIPNKFYNIYLDEIEQVNARWPNEGESTIFSVPQQNSFTFSETDPTRWTNAKNAYVFGHFSSAGWEWHQGIIQSVNAATKTITITGAAGDTMKTTAAGTGWHAANLLEELDMPGEWFVDTEGLKLYYYPPYRLKDRKLEMTTYLGTLLTFDNAHNIRIKGIKFSKNYQPLSFKGSSIRGVTVEKCDFSHSQSKITVQFANGTRTYDINILENKAYNLYGNFVYFRAGDLNTLTNGNCLVKNNHIIQASQYYKGSGAMSGPYQVSNFGSTGVSYENNIVQDLPGGAAIGTGGTHVKIMYNEVVNAGKSMSDYGAIYFGRSTSYFDTEVAYNFLHDFNDSNNYNALYNDDAYSGAYWHHNVVANMYQPCIQAPGFNTRYMYNVSVNTAKTGSIGSRKSYSDSIHYKGYLWKETNDLIYNNEEVYRKEYPQIFEWLERKDDKYYNVCFDSIYFGNVGIGSTHLNNFVEMADYGAKEMERNGETISIEGMNGQNSGNPKYDYSDDVFVDVKNQNYNINPESQVAKDFPELLDIDVTKSGLTEDALYMIEKPKTGSHLRYPTNGQKGINASEITFSWDPVKGASFYRIIVATDPQLENVVYDKEMREDGNFNKITLKNFANNTVYYWKVVAKSIIRQNQFEIDSLGGPYAFKTAVRDALSKENLNLAITAYEEFCKSDLKNPEYEFDADFVKNAESKLDEFKNIYKNARTQAELDAAEEEVYFIIKKSPFFMKLRFENLDGVYDKDANWETAGNVSVDSDGVLTFSSEAGTRPNAKTTIKNRNAVVCFKMKLADLGTTAGNYQGFDIKMGAGGRGYLVVFKHDIIEWQRINVSLTEIPNDFIEAGKWYDVEAGGINTPNGVLQFLRVDGRVIYAELDQTGNQTRDEGWFQIRKNQLGDIQIKDMEVLPEDGIIVQDLLDAFEKPASDKHLQTLFIGSSDVMEMGSSELFTKLDKAKLAGIVYPVVTSTKIATEPYNVSGYKKMLEEMCLVAGYNQGLSELVLINKIDFRYNDILKVETIDTNGVTIYAGYKSMTDKFKAAATDLMMRGNCKNIDELRKHIAKYMLVGTINACYTCFAGQSEYISNVLTKENADYIGMDISDYLALTPEQKLKANDKIGNGHAGDSVNRRFDQLLEDIHEAVKAVK